MKKLIAIMLILLLALGAGACSPGNQESETPDDSDNSGRASVSSVITEKHSGSSRASGRQTAEKFEKGVPGYIL